MEFVDIYPWQMWAIFAATIIILVLYITDFAPMETISLGLLAGLVLFFYLFPVYGASGEALLPPERLLAGFANPALLAVLALMVVGQGLFHSGVLDGPTAFLSQRSAGRPFLVSVMVLGTVFAISAFLNNTPVAVMFIPVLAALARARGGGAGQMMMPLSFACILGGMTTLIGSSTNLLAAGAAEIYGGARLGFFDITVPALILAVPGLVYVLLVMPRLLPREKDEAPRQISSGRQYIVEIRITSGHELEGVRAQAGIFPPLAQTVILMLSRRGVRIFPPFEETILRAGDVIVLAATRARLAKLLAQTPALFRIEEEKSGSESELVLAEAIIAPASRMLGRTMAQLDLRRETGCIALGVQRRGRMQRAAARDIRLEAGDILLLLGSNEALRDLAYTHEAIMLDTTEPALPVQAHPLRALAVFAATVLAAASGLVPIVIAALSGAAVMIAAGALNIRQAARAVDRRIFLLVAAALALAAALDATGGAQFLARSLIMVNEGAPPAFTLSVLFLLVALITNVLTNNAAAVLFTPVAMSMALDLNLPPHIFAVTIILAANCSFATPMAYQTNLLVMEPGNYRFRDYVRAGLPLLFLLWIIYTLFIPAYYGL